MLGRQPGCEARLRDDGREAALIPVCMGGAAIEGAFESINGCNHADECVAQLRVIPGTALIIQRDKENPEIVRGVLEVRRATSPAE